MGKYDRLTLLVLRQELGKRGAKRSGRKKELIERLEAYDRNSNFGCTTSDLNRDDDWHMSVPLTTNYRDVTGNTIPPPISSRTVDQFLHPLGTSLNRNARELYDDRFIRFMRFCKTDGTTFLKTQCRAKMRRTTTYDIDLSLDEHGNILQTQCECAAGMGPYAHCKHIRAAFLPLLDNASGKAMTLELTCTETVQSFHRPRRLHNGSPVKAEHLDMSMNKSNIIFNPIPLAHRVDSQTTYTRVTNATINFAASSTVNPALMHITTPAIMHAFDNDHDYCTLTPSEHYLQVDTLTNISQEQATQIEQNTRGQAVVGLWHERTKRMTASRFGRICKITKRTDADKFARSLQQAKSISAAPLEHGRKYESIALKGYIEKTGNDVTTSGLVICSERPYLACSPDGIVDDTTVIEIKCPYVSRDKPITPVTVPYLVLTKNGKVVLNRNHDYMYQVQGNMHITKKKQCHLVIFTLVDLVIVDVLYDDTFVNDMLTRLETFFHDHYRKEYLNKHFYLQW